MNHFGNSASEAGSLEMEPQHLVPVIRTSTGGDPAYRTSIQSTVTSYRRPGDLEVYSEVG